MTFKELKLPKDLSKKKRMELYKCWILTSLQKGSDQRVLELNTDIDRYGLSKEAAFHLAINKMGTEFFDSGKTPFDFLSNKLIVIIKFILLPGSIDEEIIIPPSDEDCTMIDPAYDPDPGIISATVRDRISDLEIKNYQIEDISCEIDHNTGIIFVKDLNLREQVINKSLTGG